MAHKTLVQIIRERARLTRKELGREIGMSDASIWWFEEQGKKVPVENAWLLLDVAAAHGMAVTLDQLYAPFRVRSVQALKRRRQAERAKREEAAA
ncbi:MAG: hypothetical protein IIZ92_03365 [Aquincola sp.]|nr:hypothetical protein [Aquincola sp.]